MLDPILKEQYREEAKRLKLPNPYTAALTIKLRDLKALHDEQESNAILNQKATPQATPRVYPPEPFKDMNLKEYMLNSTTTGKRFRMKYKPTLPRPAIRPSTEMIQRLLDKTTKSPVGQLCLSSDDMMNCCPHREEDHFNYRTHANHRVDNMLRSTNITTSPRPAVRKLYDITGAQVVKAMESNYRRELYLVKVLNEVASP